MSSNQSVIFELKKVGTFVNGYSVQTDHLFPRQIDHLFSSGNLVEICR
jgi:hypothetical protein